MAYSLITKVKFKGDALSCLTLADCHTPFAEGYIKDRAEQFTAVLCGQPLEDVLNSMTRWVQCTLASSDFTHPDFGGTQTVVGFFGVQDRGEGIVELHMFWQEKYKRSAREAVAAIVSHERAKGITPLCKVPASPEYLYMRNLLAKCDLRSAQYGDFFTFFTNVNWSPFKFVSSVQHLLLH